jgi:hypothetical protein
VSPTGAPTSRFGCTYTAATNFAQFAEEDDGSCVFETSPASCACDVSAVDIHLAVGWNWMSFVPLNPTTLLNAVSIAGGGFQLGDAMKSKEQNAVAATREINGETVLYWSGSLGLETSLLYPGVGYHANVSGAFTFAYDSALTGSCPTADTPMLTPERRRALSGSGCTTTGARYEDTAVVTAMVFDLDGNPMTDGRGILAALDESCQARTRPVAVHP